MPEEAKLLEKTDSNARDAEFNFLTEVDRSVKRLPKLSNDDFNNILCRLINLDLPPQDPILSCEHDREENIDELSKILIDGDASTGCGEASEKIIDRDKNKVPGWLAHLDCIGGEANSDALSSDAQTHRKELIEYIATIESELGTVNETGIVKIFSSQRWETRNMWHALVRSKVGSAMKVGVDRNLPKGSASGR